MRVLLIDSAFAAAPIYDYLVKTGHDVWVMGNRPHDLLAGKVGTNWIRQDYSKALEVDEHVRRLKIERVVPGCTDISLETCLTLRTNLPQFDSLETNAFLSNKAAFRNLCIDLGLSAPRTVDLADFPIPGKFICKPIDSYSGRGITVFDGLDAIGLRGAYDVAKRVSPTGNALVETFAAGDLYSCSAFIEQRKLRDVFYVREGSSAHPFAVDTSYVTYDLPPECRSLLEANLEKLSSALNLKDGLLHTQFILADSVPFIVEVSRRCPGDLYPLLIEYSTGYPYAAKYASCFIGAALTCGEIKRRHVLRHTVSSIDAAVFEGLRFRDFHRVLAYFPIAQVGQALLARQGSRAGVLFTEAPSHDGLLADFERFMSRIAYDLTW